MSAASERLVSGAGFLREEMGGEGGQKPPCKCQPELEKNIPDYLGMSSKKRKCISYGQADQRINPLLLTLRSHDFLWSKL